jgi:hypothetical protein
MLARYDTVVDPMVLAIAMYIAISLIVYGPDIEKAAETIRELINQATCRIDENGKVDCSENAKYCSMNSEPGDSETMPYLIGHPIARNAIYEALHVKPP